MIINDQLIRTSYGKKLVKSRPLDKRISEKFERAIKGESINYIVNGDSTRAPLSQSFTEYYRQTLGQLGVSVVHNSLGGLSIDEWLNNTHSDTASLQRAIDNTPGQGENTVMEFSLLLNNSDDPLPTIKTYLEQSLSAYLAAKPLASIVLVTPVATGRTYSQHNEFNRIYNAVGNDFNLPVIDIYRIMRPVQPDSRYYEDSTHPNIYGAMRFINYILNELLPKTMIDKVNLTSSVEGPSGNVLGATESGFWVTSSGSGNSDSDWRRSPELAVLPGAVMRYQHQGNRSDLILRDAQNQFIRNMRVYDNELFLVPQDAAFLRMNISSDGAAYDATGDVAEMTYALTSGERLTQGEVNKGLSLQWEV